MSVSELEKELAHLHEQIERIGRNRDTLTSQLRLVEAELERVSAHKQQFDAVQGICNALDRLKELKADELFWEGVAEARQAAGHLERVRSRVARFQQEINGILEQQSSLRAQINTCVDELDVLHDAVRAVHDREARQEEEYVIEREISPVPVMPWSDEAERERPFRKALLVSAIAALVLSVLIPLLKVPAPVRPVVAVVPERLVSMLRKEPPKPEPPKEEKKPEKEQEEKASKEEKPKPTAQETQAARKKAEGTGVLAYKESLKELVEETSAARLGAAARLSSPSAAGPRVSRSLVALPPSAGGSSGGIGNSGISRTIESDSGKRIGAVGFTRVESKVAELKVEAKPVSSGSGPARTDEEIQIVFDKYKAALYRMYNTGLRKDPTLRGRIILRITIEPGGEVSACTVQSSDLRSPELVAMIVERVKKFNFGPKEKASRTAILYPIDFLPPG